MGKIMKATGELERLAYGSGFHRNIQSIFELSCRQRCCTVSQCDILIIEHISYSLHIDLFELSRNSNYKALLDYNVNNKNMETNARVFDHSQHLYIFSNLKCLDRKLSLNINISIHLQNEESNIGDEFVYTELPNPLILIKCPKIDLRYPIMKAPCDDKNVTDCYWSNVEYESTKQALVFIVPVGNLFNVWFIVGFIALFVIAGCIYITYKVAVRNCLMERLKLN